jgi:hypothetical protein
MYIIRDSKDSLVWRLVVDRDDRLRRRPGVRIEAAVFAHRYQYQRVQVVRAIAHGATLFWGHRSEPWDTYANFVRGTPAARTTALPPVTLATARACTENAGSSAWWLYWMQHAADALAAAPEGVLLSGMYDLRPARFARPLTIEAFPAQRPPSGHVAIELTREPPKPDDDRVSMWRKHAAQGVPPGLVYDWVCTPGPLLVDGHDRMFASLLEGQPAQALQLTPVAYGGGNRRLTGGVSFGPTLADELYAFGRVTPLPGGVPAWKREASARLWAVRETISSQLADRMMRGLEGVVPA